MGKLAGKVALVTGASRGIGRAIAQILSEAGAQILVVHRDSAAGAEETFRGLSGKGHRVIQASVNRLRCAQSCCCFGSAD